MPGARPRDPQPQPALLLLGPTGAGKSPLGDALELQGLNGRRCHHFDFGANLRWTVQNPAEGVVTATELEFLRQVLEEGALLENERFELAGRILAEFTRRRGVSAADWLVLNGLPRHIGQAQALAPYLNVSLVLELVCPEVVVCQRLRSNTGGDRLARTDDTPLLVRRKLAEYEQRTRPLAEWYQRQGTRYIALTVGVDTQPAQLLGQLNQLWKL